MPNDSSYPETPVSLISAVRRGTEDEAALALAMLCERYLNPTYGLVRKLIFDQDRARDVTHDFFEWILVNRGGLIKKWNSELGQFRAYFRTCLKNRIANNERDQRAGKRGGGIFHFSFDRAEEIFADFGTHAPTPDLAFDLIWADGVLQVALRNLEQEMITGGRGETFERFKISLLGVTPDYRSLAGETGIDGRALRTGVCRLRKRFREAVRDELRKTMPKAASEAEVDAEMETLKKLMGRSSSK